MISTTQQPNVYLAGPGVFRPDTIAFGEMLKAKCAHVGLIGLFPMDNEVPKGSAREQAAFIYRSNVDLIDSSQAIIADISPFRGPNMDPGTAWEIGYGVAKRLPIFAWTDDFSHLRDRTLRIEGRETEEAIDRDGWTVENFQHVENLMIANSATAIFRDHDAAIAACAAALIRGRL